MPKHHPVHLQAEDVDFPTVRVWERYVVRLRRALLARMGWSLVGNVDPRDYAVCGVRIRSNKVVRRDQRERVTCLRCKTYIQEYIG